MKIEKNPYMGLKIVNSPWKEIEETIPGVEVTGALDNNIEVNAAGVNKGLDERSPDP